MKKAFLVALSAWTMLLFFHASASAEAQIDPYFTQWASFQPGSSVTLVGWAVNKTETTAFVNTITLKQTGNEFLMLEISRKEEGVEPKVKSKKVQKYLESNDKTEFRGQEEISVNGKKLKCSRHTLIYMDKSGNEFIRFEYWFHPEIPGAAKISASAGSERVNQTAVGWEKK